MRLLSEVISICVVRSDSLLVTYILLCELAFEDAHGAWWCQRPTKVIEQRCRGIDVQHGAWVRNRARSFANGPPVISMPADE